MDSSDILRNILTSFNAFRKRCLEYHVGSEYGWSSLYRFKAMQDLTNHEYIYAVYGDLGVVNARSLGKIQQQAQRSLIDAVLHIGQSKFITFDK